VYRPTIRMQIGDPTTRYDSAICTMESAAMALDFETQGGIKVWGGELLPFTGLSDAGISDGTNLQDAARAWAHWGKSFNRIGGSWDDANRELNAGRGIVLQGDYDQFNYTTKWQKDFQGNHAVYINPERHFTQLLMLDPLGYDSRWVEEAELYRYGKKLADTQGGGRFFFASTAAHPDSAEMPDTSTSGVTLKYGGREDYRGTWATKESGSRFRTKPYLDAPIIETVAAGYRWNNKQTTDQGAYVNGSRRWLGDASGDRWMHVSLLKLVP
jgi:hypothetical protein